MNSLSSGNPQERSKPDFPTPDENQPVTPLEQVPSLEQPEQPNETQPEAEPRQPETTPEPAEQQPLPSAKPLPASQPAPSTPKDETLTEVETILANNLSDIFVQMTPAQQEAFRQKGEETAQKIKTLLDTAKAKTKKILKLIRDWLKTIPGVNKYFLEQEAKIKTDKVMEIAETKKRNQLNIEP